MATSAQFDHWPDLTETGIPPRLPQRIGQPVIIQMHRMTALVANQEDAIVQAAGMRIGKIGVGAFNPVGQIGAHEQVEYAVNAVGCDAPPVTRTEAVGDVIGTKRAVLSGQHIEDISSQRSPLFARANQHATGGMHQLIARMLMVMMCRHGPIIVGQAADGNQPASCINS